jgi:hypothetical protein
VNCVPVHATFSFHDGTHVDVVMVGVRSRNAQLVFSERAVGPRHSTIDNRQTSIVDCRKSKIGDQSDCVLIVLAGFLFDNSTFDGSSTISWM